MQYAQGRSQGSEVPAWEKTGRVPDSARQQSERSHCQNQGDFWEFNPVGEITLYFVFYCYSSARIERHVDYHLKRLIRGIACLRPWLSSLPEKTKKLLSIPWWRYQDVSGGNQGLLGKTRSKDRLDVFQTSGAMWPWGVTSSNHQLRGQAIHPKLEVPWISLQAHVSPQGKRWKGERVPVWPLLDFAWILTGDSLSWI